MSALKKFDKTKLNNDLPPKKEVNKKAAALDIDKKIKQIHEGPQLPPQVAAPPVREAVVKVSVDMPDSIYGAMKAKVAQTKETHRAYILRLVKEDLNL